jgi:hypothetical protein
MEYLGRSFPIVEHNSSLGYGNNINMLLELSQSEALHIILRQTDKQKG